MKKGILVAVGVLGLLALMWWADRKFPAGPRIAGTTATTPTDAPTVALKDLNDHDVTIGQFKGQVVLVNFWATWCEPCKAEIPWMIEFQKKYSARGFTILGVSMDEDGKKAVQPFLDKQRFDVNGQQEAMNYPIVFGNDAIAGKFGGVMGLPTTMLFNRDGKKVRTVVGIVDHDEMDKVIAGML